MARFRQGASRLFLALVLSLVAPAVCLALQVKSIQPSGILVMEDGSQVLLAGVSLEPESFTAIRVIVSGKDLSFEEEHSKDYENLAPVRPGYLFVKTSQINFPFKAKSRPHENKIMINELLLSLGLARVDAARSFKRKKNFLKIEAAARQKGSGVWSFETPVTLLR